MLVLDVATGDARVTEELWSDSDAKRLMVCGKFDHLIVATIPAKDLRAHVRRKGIVSSTDSHKSLILERAIHEWIATSGA